ncbi:MAG: NnrU family protein [Betaproteobacteria bacterium]
MSLLILGLIVFLGAHSLRIFADSWRTAQVARMGEGPWKGLYSLVSIAGFVLLIWGFGRARADTTVLWQPPSWTHYVAALFTLVAFVLVVAAYVRGTRIKSVLHHPMILGAKSWAFGHLIANGTLADVVLFGGFLVWAIVDFGASRRRDRAVATVYPAGTAGRDAIAIAIGVLAWAVFAFYLHERWIGVLPFG